MDFRQIVTLALQASVITTVFGFGLEAAPGDLLYVMRRPGLLVRSLIAVFVVMPVIAVALVRTFDFPRITEIAMMALAISPSPPLLPARERSAGGRVAYGLGLMVVLAIGSIVAIPVVLEILERLSGRQLSMAPAAVAIVAKLALVPLATGRLVRAVWPAAASALGKPVALIGKTLLPLAALVLFAAALPAMWALLGNGTVVALVIFTVAGLAIGHLLGGPSPDHSVVLALSTACRHPAIAFVIASSNFPDQRFGAVILLYVIVSVVTGIPYLAWHRRKVAAAARTGPTA